MFRVGDRVISGKREGVVVQAGDTRKYVFPDPRPVKVKFDNGEYMSFTANGSMYRGTPDIRDLRREITQPLKNPVEELKELKSDVRKLLWSIARHREKVKGVLTKIVGKTIKECTDERRYGIVKDVMDKIK
ncbi:MAG: hypothetical protein DRR06_20020 [Gammaproteobacteria bacterium]|nr:MAG: hypothetical protein DRR06_20020 [Gammaproteobacteria bacterium]